PPGADRFSVVRSDRRRVRNPPAEDEGRTRADGRARRLRTRGGDGRPARVRRFPLRPDLPGLPARAQFLRNRRRPERAAADHSGKEPAMSHTTAEMLLWVVIPYVALAMFIGGHIWRWREDQFGWTTRSSQIYESKLLRIGSPMFHYGIIGIFLGHAVGLGIPKSWTRAIGLSDHMYHLMAITIGLAAAVACVGGLFLLIYRRRTNRRVFGATTVMDKAMYLMLAHVITFGVLATVVHTAVGSYDYREGVSSWFHQICTLQPAPTLMSTSTISLQPHILSALAIFALWPFTRLLHVLSVPLGHLPRPYIVYRSRGPAKADRRGWEKVDL